MAKIEVLKNSYIHNLNSDIENVEVLKNSYIHNLNSDIENVEVLKTIHIIHPYFNNTLIIQNDNLKYFKNILETQKLNNLKKNKLQNFFLV